LPTPPTGCSNVASVELTGGPFNPFAVLFGVHVMLALALLGRIPAAIVGACAAAGYGLQART
jgi:hypothetical protein